MQIAISSYHFHLLNNIFFKIPRSSRESRVQNTVFLGLRVSFTLDRSLRILPGPVIYHRHDYLLREMGR